MKYLKGSSRLQKQVLPNFISYEFRPSVRIKKRNSISFIEYQSEIKSKLVCRDESYNYIRFHENDLLDSGLIEFES